MTDYGGRMITSASSSEATADEFKGSEFKVILVRKHLRLWTRAREGVRDEIEVERQRLLDEARLRVRRNSDLLR